MEQLKTKHLTIMFTDMKGFTVKTSTQSRQQLQHLLHLQDELIRPAIKQFDGTIVKTIGDAFMVSFESPTDAVLCGMKIQENVLNHNVRAPSNDQFDVRIAINSGEVNLKEGDVFGEPVNVAARIESIAEPNEVYFTEAVYLSMNKNEIPTAEVGYKKLKGIPEEIKVYKVVSEKTNLIRSRLKRQEQAESHANLSKDGSHDGGHSEITPPPTTPNITQKPVEKKQSFFKRHKKKIFIALGILFLLGVLSSKEKTADIREELGVIRANYETALKNNDQDTVNKSIADLHRLASDDLPQDAKKRLREFLRTEMNAEKLTPRQREALSDIMDKLK